MGFDARSQKRIADAVHYHERRPRNSIARARYPVGGGGLAGAWAWIAPGDTITSASGHTLGQGPVTICSRDGAVLTADGDAVTTYNAGGAVTGAATTGTYVKLGWVRDTWSLDLVKC